MLHTKLKLSITMMLKNYIKLPPFITLKQRRSLPNQRLKKLLPLKLQLKRKPLHQLQLRLSQSKKLQKPRKLSLLNQRKLQQLPNHPFTLELQSLTLKKLKLQSQKRRQLTQLRSKQNQKI